MFVSTRSPSLERLFQSKLSVRLRELFNCIALLTRLLMLQLGSVEVPPLAVEGFGSWTATPVLHQGAFGSARQPCSSAMQVVTCDGCVSVMSCCFLCQRSQGDNTRSWSVQVYMFKHSVHSANTERDTERQHNQDRQLKARTAHGKRVGPQH